MLIARKTALMGSLCIFMGLTRSWGLGLSTEFGLVTVENLQPGQTYNIRELVNVPLTLTNRSDFDTDIKVEVIVPTQEQYPGMVEAGFEPVPEASWVRVEPMELFAKARQKVSADVLIAVPDDDQHLGKRYQVQLVCRTVGQRSLSAGLNCTLRFTVASRRATPEELAQRKKVDKLAEVSFDLLPRKVVLKDVKAGQRIKVPFKLSNTNDQDLIFFLHSATPPEVSMAVSEGIHPPPDPKMLEIPSKELKVKANTIRHFNAFLRIPKKEEYEGKTFVFILKVELPGDAVVLNQLSRVYVTVAE